MPPAIHVRDAREADRDTLFRFHKGLYEAHRDRVVAREDLPLIAYRDYERILDDDLRALMKDRDSVVLLAESRNVPIGYITGRIATEPRRVLPIRGVVEDWYVEEAARGVGAGTSLLRELEKRFTAAGCQVIESATWSSNDGARSAHGSLGFREIRVIYRKLL
jgi:ribosomal protein S18 acetylase RimI-like enzyme